MEQRNKMISLEGKGDYTATDWQMMSLWEIRCNKKTVYPHQKYKWKSLGINMYQESCCEPFFSPDGIIRTVWKGNHPFAWIAEYIGDQRVQITTVSKEH